MNYNRIQPNLFLGSCPDDAEDFRTLQAEGVTAVFSVQTDEDLRDNGIDPPDRLAENAGLHYCSVPITDFDNLDLKRKLPHCVRQLSDLLKSGHRVYVHCTAGVNRSPTVVVGYLHWVLGWPLETAMEYVTTCRNCCPSAELIRRAHF